MLNEAIPAAVEMAEFASAAIGGPVANDPHGNIWAFPDPESRDLAGRIFGPVRTTLSNKWPNNYQCIKNGFDYISTVTTSSSKGNTSPISSVSNTLSKSSAHSNITQVSVSRSDNCGKTSSSTRSSPPSTFSIAPARSSTIAVLSSHVASTTNPAIEATTPINMFQMNFWHQTDIKKKSTGDL
ncbi:hypothetical protein BGAL_0297g00010 [Botrytis galanthina]|uniref:Uncharacterized protein n=1 Tax=Botrytis galanthina TaxID=278940 RepID=A0A4S8R3D6_9HELO|nr:hypothetical protein BGAL_0297g00010 [Botrytis galanthina]